MNFLTCLYLHQGKRFIALLSQAKILFIMLLSCLFFSQSLLSSDSDGTSDSNFINQFINANNLDKAIVFTPDNIKRFWIDDSVSSIDNSIHILLHRTKTDKHKLESVPLGIKLDNVDESMDCKIDIISDIPDIGFSVLDINSKTVSTANNNGKDKDYYISSSTIHMDEVTAGF